ncbi:MAG TPA: 2-C-methyl-D-erythritol 4-phosphate cytidylyltransferase [Solirubrobacteraceae bacterium]|nr:2-C-methyl-D-erythritol 4-phosphate cytidylyltransferase [Solirubrobacteraceae bacterium]
MAVALVVAAGRGERLGTPVPKAFAILAGRPMVEWSIAALQQAAAVTEIVVALPPGVPPPAGTIGVPGGSERSHSVRAALAAAPGDDVVVVHDAARPLVTAELIAACLDALGDADAAIAATPVTDTIKECEGERVVRTLDRSRLWAVQTPQVFRRAALERALAQDDGVIAAATDDATLVEALGGTVRVVPSPPENLKVTTALDLRVAELLLRDGVGRGGS